MKMLDVMKNLKKASSIFIICYLIFFTVFMPSCNRTEQSNQAKISDQKAFDQAFSKADFYEYNNPDSALILTNKALDLMQNLRFKSNDTLFSLFEIKANAYSSTGMPDSAIAVWEKLRLIAINKSDSTLQADAALRAGEIALNQSNINYAEKFLLEAIALYEKKLDTLGMGIAYRTYGSLLTTKEDYKQAQFYGLKAYDIFQSLDRLRDLSSVCINIGNVFNATGSRAEELEYNRKAIRFASQAYDTANLISVLNNMGIYYKKSIPDSAIWYYQKALSLSPPNKPSSDVLQLKYNMANLYYRKNDLQKALSIYEQILEISKSESIYIGTIMASLGISSVYVKSGDFQKSFQTLKSAERLADSIGDVSLRMTVMDAWKEHYQQQGNYKEAYHLLSMIKSQQDSTLNIEKQVAIHEMEKVLQTQKKEAENQRLNAEVDSQNKDLRYRFYIILLLILVALLSIFFSWKGYSLYRERSYAYNVLMKKYSDEKEHIEGKADSQQSVSEAQSPQTAPRGTDPLTEQLIHYFSSEKPYLDPKLKVDDVAAKLKTSQKAIAFALKQHKNTNFNTFTNQYRVDEAKRILQNTSTDFNKIEPIVSDAGFGSKSSFYAVFEQFTGVKPSYYRKYIVNMKVESEE
jgi:tetratricopeptide (TPR) repeat protein